MRLLGLDPGLNATGWGVVESDGARLSHRANGTVRTRAGDDLARRLAVLDEALAEVIATWAPDSAAIEETFVNRNPGSALKLGLARGVVMLAPARLGIPVAEYNNSQVKKAVVGSGRASKEQMQLMVRHLLPGCEPGSADAADALAVAICHALHATTGGRWAAATAGSAA
ncbi:MAG: crossover junction endodeoxyribonuclease RuvC [Alphaproteobacteria bacterium]|jgi:crossover junction endodeoxyribonuclease RuvC|nr:crossover junction endodeoxyribonuclease RuvC [Alphaproteobacteria bacterium]